MRVAKTNVGGWWKHDSNKYKLTHESYGFFYNGMQNYKKLILWWHAFRNGDIKQFVFLPYIYNND